MAETMQIPVTTSHQIRVCRVLCIFFLMYVHVFPGLEGIEAQLEEPLAVIKFLVVDLLARGSVPALTLISGFLMANMLRYSSVLDITKRRSETILVPMVTWNIIAILLGLLVFAVLGHQLPPFQDMQGMSLLSVLAFKVLALDNHGSTVALNFLRDLFVCGLFIKPLAWGVRKGGIAFVALVWAFGLLVGFAPVVFRTGVPLFFTLGIYLAVRHGHLRYSAASTSAMLVLLMVVLAVEYYGGVDRSVYGQQLYSIYAVLKRVVVASLFLIASHAIVSSNRATMFFRAERDIFLVFLAHSVVFLVAWELWRRLFGSDLDGPYVLFFLASPIVFLAVVVLTAPRLDFLPGWLQTGLRGRALRKTEHAGATSTSHGRDL